MYNKNLILNFLNAIGNVAYRDEHEMSANECMELLELMFDYLLESEDGNFCIRGILIINTAWFPNKQDASRRLGFDLTKVDDGYYFLNKDGQFQPIDYDFVIFVTGSLFEEIQKRAEGVLYGN